MSQTQALALPFAFILIQAVTGLFFLISGYHKLFHPARHKALVETLRANGIPLLSFNSWFVPLVEFGAGSCLFLALFLPFLAPLVALASLGLIAICVVACATDGRKRIEEWKPIDKADVLDDWLYLPETLYLVFLAQIFILNIHSLTRLFF